MLVKQSSIRNIWSSKVKAIPEIKILTVRQAFIKLNKIYSKTFGLQETLDMQPECVIIP